MTCDLAISLSVDLSDFVPSSSTSASIMAPKHSSKNTVQEEQVFWAWGIGDWHQENARQRGTRDTRNAGKGSCLHAPLGRNLSVSKAELEWAVSPLNYLCTYPSIYLHICLSPYLSFFLDFYLFITLPIYLSISLSLHVCIYPSTCLSIYLYLSICLSVCFSMYLSICLSVCLSLFLYLYRSISLSLYLSIYLSL